MSDDIMSKLLDAKTRSKLDEKSSEFGFIDSQEAIRCLVNGFVNGDFELVEELDDETAKKVLQAKKEIRNGNYITVDPEDPEDFKRLLQG